NVFDPCRGFLCFNGGYCIAPADAPYCSCPPGFSGQRCEIVLGGQKPGLCPRVSDADPRCIGVLCRSDRDCRGSQKCCRNNCGDNVCAVPDFVQPPSVNISNPCATIRCTSDTECRVVFKCGTCEPTVQCVSRNLIDDRIDFQCRRRGYQEALLVDGPIPSSPYTALQCRGPYATSRCPRGSTCVDDQRGGGSCCRGFAQVPEKPGSCPSGDVSVCGGIFCENDYDCPDDRKCCAGCGRLCTPPVPPVVCDPPCRRGFTCDLRAPYCPPGRACILILVAQCIRNECLKCRSDERCVQTGYGDRYQCVSRNLCGPRPCPPNQDCVYVGNECPAPRPGDLAERKCRDVYECRKVDQCNGCPRGYVCINTGIVCVTAPCPSFQCVRDNECGGCRPGQRCREVLACRPPQPCQSVFQCTDDKSVEPLPPFCPLACSHLSRCVVFQPKCYHGDSRTGCQAVPDYRCLPLWIKGGDDS
ncbi:unnamed protein product, partial [Lymnaea stagnalis]